MLKSITTTNFKKLGSHSFDFTDGLNIVSGDNAAGKTTLTMALSFAFYGVKAIPGTVEQIPTWGQKDCKVVVEFGEFTIERTLKNCKIYKAGELEVTGNSVCSGYIEENITGVDLRGFRMLNWSEQGETGALLTLGATQLQRDVEKLSGVEFIDEIIKLASVDMSALKRDVDSFESVGTVKELNKRLAELVQEIEKSSAEIARFKQLKTVSEREKLEAIKKLDSFEKINAKAEKGARTLASLEASIEAGDANIEGLLDEKSNLLAEINTLATVDIAKHEAKKLLLKQCRATNAKMDAATESLAVLDEKLTGIGDKIQLDGQLQAAKTSAMAELEAKREAAAEAKREIAKADANLSRIEKAISSGICEACGQTIDTEESIAAHKVELKEARLERAKLLDSAQDIYLVMELAEDAHEKALEDYRKGFGGWAAKKAGWLDDKVQYDDYLAANEYTTGLDKVEKELEKELVDITKKDAATAGLKKAETRLHNATEELKILEETRAKTIADTPDSVSDEDIAEVKQAILSSELTYNQTVEALHDQEFFLNGKLGEQKVATQALELEKANRETLNEIKNLSDFVQYLKDSRIRFLSSVWANILGAASAFLTQATDGVITALMKSDKEGFMFCENEVYAPVAVASGAQKGFIGVAIRLALSQSLQSSCAIVVLDEPTEAMREENALRLSGALLGHGQVVMVTHRESDKLSASNIIEI